MVIAPYIECLMPLYFTGKTQTITNESRFDMLNNTIDKYQQRMKILSEEGRAALQGVADRLYSEMQILRVGKV